MGNRPLIAFEKLRGWDSIGWCIAFFIGIWGVLIGTGDYASANGFFILTAVVSVAKWAHQTQIHRRARRVFPFLGGVVFLAGICVAEYHWTQIKLSEAVSISSKLDKLALLPGLQEEVAEIPSLKSELADLQKENTAAAQKVMAEQATVEGLDQVVIAQQKTIAEDARKDLAKTTKTLSGQVEHSQALVLKDIDQYRTDTTSAVSRIMRPQRTLGDNRMSFIATLRAFGPHDIAISLSRGADRETLTFGDEVKSAFKDAGWNLVPTQKLIFIITDAPGLFLITKVFSADKVPISELPEGQADVFRALHGIGMEPKLAGQANGENGAAELYIGLE